MHIKLKAHGPNVFLESGVASSGDCRYNYTYRKYHWELIQERTGLEELRMSSIETVGLVKVFKPNNIVAVKDLDLKISSGSVFAFLGPNGAGKTTTVRLLTCLLKPTSGEAFVNGLSVHNDSQEIRRSVGILTDQPGLYERLTARRNLQYYARMYNVPNTDLDKRVKTLARSFDLIDRLDSPVGTYSKGMRQKLGLLRAMIHEPSVLFLDEPTAALDPVAAKTVRNTILDVTKDSATTVFLTTHNLSEAERIASLIGIIDHGNLVAMGSASELKSRLTSKDQISVSFHELKPEFVSVVEELPNVLSVEKRSDEILDVVTKDPYNDVPIIVKQLVTKGAKITEVKRVDMGLEDVYFAISRGDANNAE